MTTFRRLLIAFGLAALLSGCGYNDFQRLDEQVKSGWAEVLNQYQRRADLVPNLVATVKGAASFERETFEAVTEARAKVGQGHAVALGDPPGYKHAYVNGRSKLGPNRGLPQGSEPGRAPRDQPAAAVRGP